jgi:hypothetical protein
MKGNIPLKCAGVCSICDLFFTPLPARQGCIKLGLVHAGTGLHQVFPLLTADPQGKTGGCPPALSGALFGFTLLLWQHGHGNVGLTMAGGEV